jgi:YidC/Oxa1 family membrane protein insertase
MDTKRMVTAMAVAFIVIMLYTSGVNWLFRHNNWKAAPDQTATSQPAAVDSTTGFPSTQSTQPSSQTSISAAPTTQVAVVSAGNIQPAALGSDVAKDPNYAMQLKLTPEGAAIESVILNQFKLKVDKPDLYSFQSTTAGREDRALASRSITVNGHTINLASANWSLENSTKEQASYSIDIANGDQKLARIHKLFQVDSVQKSKDTSEGYEVTLTTTIENLSGAPLKVSQVMNGTLPPLAEVSRMDRVILGGYDNNGILKVDYRVLDELNKDHPSRDITKSDKTNLPMIWAGFGGVYFDCIVRPLTNSLKQEPAQYLQKVETSSLNPEEPLSEQKQAIMTVQTVEQTIDPGQSLVTPMKIFLGPKQRSLLRNGYYNSPMIGLDQSLVLSSGPCSVCTFDWLVDALVTLLRGFHWLIGGWASGDGHTGDWGLAIILMVCLVRLCLHPITKKSQVNMMKMSKMGPEMQRLKEKHGDDKEAITKAQMDMYKQMGFTPVLGCLPMFLQMPIFIALWQALQTTFELRHAPFLWGMLHWPKDLSQPDRLIPFGHSIPLLFGWHIDAINILPMLVAVVSFLNMKYTPRPPAATPEAEQQQKMMQWMTLIFPLMFYSLPSGLNLYYLTSTSLGIWEGKRIRAHIKQHEDAEKGGKVFIEAPKGMKKKKRDDDNGTGVRRVTPPKPGLGGWLANLQQRVEDMREQGDKQNRKKP